MTKAAIRTIVLIFWAGLFFQLLIINKYKAEPYPAIRFPSFSSTGQNGGFKKINQYEVYLHSDDQQDSILYSLDQFLPKISYNKPSIDLIASNYQNSKERTSEKKEFEDWVSKNLKENIPDKEISNISILEMQYNYDLNTNELEKEGTLINYVKIELQSNE
ncbi:hypothetical protein [Algoriphagus machipongonensis]|uniref:Uncharacterized protein n=1 Tax=Algoriphagus machipongonensis TaxID=388413 RepID=A3HYR1_9BACT|nr:hypothetical protein [Algoriphagus machipongonensis]EAZ80397.1 hypothetical protein ALPR1_05725 [Algoriphagus machipongonensis]